MQADAEQDWFSKLELPEAEVRVVDTAQRLPRRSLNTKATKKSPQKPRGPRKVLTEIDLERRLLVIRDANGKEEWALDGFPEHIRYWLIGNGLRGQLQKQGDRSRAYGDLRDGVVPAQGSWRRHGPINDLAMAIAAAMADEINEREPGLGEEEVRLRAEKLAFDLRRDEREAMRELPVVMRYLAQLREGQREESVIEVAHRLRMAAEEKKANGR